VISLNYVAFVEHLPTTQVKANLARKVEAESGGENGYIGWLRYGVGEKAQSGRRTSTQASP